MQSDKAAVLAQMLTLEFEKLLNPILHEYQLTSPQYKLLKYLFPYMQGSIRQADLERVYTLTHSTASGLLEKLEKKGFIQRQINPNDARSRIVTLTERSQELWEKLERAGEALEQKMTADMSEAERLQLIELLQKSLSQFES